MMYQDFENVNFIRKSEYDKLNNSNLSAIYIRIQFTIFYLKGINSSCGII